MVMRQTSRILHPASCIQDQAGQPATGFTLVEILIAIFIFAVIVTTIFASFRTVFSNTDVLLTGQTYYEMAKNCLNRMTIDLQSTHVALFPAYSPPDLDDPPDPFRIVGDTVYIKGQNFPRFRFTSLAHLPFNNSRLDGLAEIIYYVVVADDETFVLKRSDNLYPLQPLGEKADDPVLCEGIKTVRLKFYDQTETEYETWDSESEEFKYATPKAVYIGLELDDGSESLLFETTVTLPVSREAKE